MLAAVIAALVCSLIAAGILVYAVVAGPARLDRYFRSVLVEYKEWKDGDYRFKRIIGSAAVKLAEIHDHDPDNLDRLRIERARLTADLERLENLNRFLCRENDSSERVVTGQIEEVERRIDEHPQREQELEETRNRLVARIEDIKRAEERGELAF